jgi:hypothetical protein
MRLGDKRTQATGLSRISRAREANNPELFNNHFILNRQSQLSGLNHGLKRKIPGAADGVLLLISGRQASRGFLGLP